MIRILAAACTAAAVAVAQVSTATTATLPLGIDSGYLANGAPASAAVWRLSLPVAGDWVQLHFRDTHLPAGSRLRLWGSGLPAAVQWHDAASLLDYRGWSCQLAGPTIEIELWAAPRSNGNRAYVDLARTVTFDGTDSLCDGGDDRVASNDPRSCRFDVTCSAWLYSEYAVGTAGHCVSGGFAGAMLHFDVPPSTAAGTPQPAHPDDQYALSPFVQFADAGVGQDWATLAAVRNSNTALFPGQAQGAWYPIAPPSPIAAGTIRVTGYGSGGGVTGSPTASLAQKTHTGPRVPIAVTDALGYRVDTTAGNSGSPILDEATGAVVGVHTHGGCGYAIGENKGTSSARADWTAARQATLALHTVGGFRTFGQGCGGAAGVPALGFHGVPELGRVYSVRVNGLNPAPGLLGMLMVGFSTQAWSGGALPADLAMLGMAGCDLQVGDDAIDVMASAAGYAVRSYVVPAAPVWLGVELSYQYFGLDPTAPNAAQAVASNAGTVRFGN